MSQTSSDAEPSSGQPAPAAVVNASTMNGKVMCGYQGWFNTPTDGADRGWVHWGPGKVSPGNCTVDLWPDMTDYAPDLRYPTDFHHADGTPAEVFSPHDPKTVDLHFRWMREYGIDGVFLQRFAGTVANPSGKAACDKVLDNVRLGAKHYGRVYGVMYDLSGVRAGGIDAVIADWKSLEDRTHATKDARYIHQDGRPVVAVWGIGFTDDRDPLLDDALKLIDFLKHDPVYGGNAVMIGVPPDWRTIDTADVPNAKMLQVAQAADVVSPWAVGRFGDQEGAERFAAKVWQPDVAWCRDHHVAYMPVVFPGFSWYNLRHGKTTLNQIPRQGGRFLWSQYALVKQAGAVMAYQAMFDEVDEGTAIFKCTNNPPDGEGKSQFVTYEGLPSDFYLRLVGEATRLIRGDIGPQQERLIGKYEKPSPAK